MAVQLLFWFLSLLLLGATFYFIWTTTHELRYTTALAFLIKIVAACLLGVMYSSYYTIGDTWHFFNDGTLLAGVARSNLGLYFEILSMNADNWTHLEGLTLTDPRAIYMARIVSVFCLLTGDQYYLIALWFAAIAFIAQWNLIRVVHRLWPDFHTPILLALFFLPTSVCWTSGIIKETLAFAGLCFLLQVALEIWSGKIRWTSILVLPVIWILWNLKYYYVAVFVPVCLLAFLLKGLSARGVKRRWQLVIWLSVLGIPLLLSSTLHPNLRLDRILEVIVANYDAFIALSAPGDAVIYQDLQPTVASMLSYAPKAFLAAAFRPMLWEAHGILQWATALENTGVLLLVIVLLFRGKVKVNPENFIPVLALITYILLLGVLLALSTPNFGTLVRYRIGFYPIMVALLLCHPWIQPRVNRLKEFLP